MRGLALRQHHPQLRGLPHGERPHTHTHTHTNTHTHTHTHTYHTHTQEPGQYHTRTLLHTHEVVFTETGASISPPYSSPSPSPFFASQSHRTHCIFQRFCFISLWCAFAAPDEVETHGRLVLTAFSISLNPHRSFLECTTPALFSHSHFLSFPYYELDA